MARLEGWRDRYFAISNRHYRFHLDPRRQSLSRPWLQDETGEICRRIDPPRLPYLDEGLQIWQRSLAHLALTLKERAIWYGLPEAGPRRREWLLGRVAAKDAVRQWMQQALNLTLAPLDVEILPNADGAPEVIVSASGAEGPRVGVSISHSAGTVVAVAFDLAERVGIDIERKGRANMDDVARAAFLPEELALLERAGCAGDTDAMLRLWCAKEAAAKARGTGFGGAPHALMLKACAPGGGEAVLTDAASDFATRLFSTDDTILAIARPARKATRS
jgi:phosphopantetheinyl transferase